MPTNVRQTLLFCGKTDATTNWPTPQAVIMQKGVQLQGALSPDRLTRRSAPGHRWALCSHTPDVPQL